MSGPPAPKRRRTGNRAERLSGFAAAARAAQEHKKLEDSATLIAAAYRGSRVRDTVASLRPESASSTLFADDDIPEEIQIEEDSCFNSTLDSKDVNLLAEQMAMAFSHAADGGAESALDDSTDFESSADSHSGTLDLMMAAVQQQPPRPPPQQHERTCAICLGEMLKRHRGNPWASSSSSDGPEALSVTTLGCSHKFHRRCLLGWVRQAPPGLCPLCREPVVVVRKNKRREAAW